MPGGSACGSPGPPATAQELGLATAGPNKTWEKGFFFPGQTGVVGLSWVVGSVPAG